MIPGPVGFYFDYVDPVSYVQDELLRRLLPSTPASVDYRPFELRPPPEPLLHPETPEWKTIWTRAERAAHAEGITLARPPLTPWSRKAHELALHAREKGCFDQMHGALFRAHFAGGEDIGRVDVLVALAAAVGLDGSEVKAVLDVDRFLEPVRIARADAEAKGVRRPPTLLVGERTLEGLQGRDVLTSLFSR